MLTVLAPVLHNSNLNYQMSGNNVQLSPGLDLSSQIENVSKCQYDPHRLGSKFWNFYAKITNGNRGARGSGIKLLHWNKGPSFLHNKQNDIEGIIASHHPHV